MFGEVRTLSVHVVSANEKDVTENGAGRKSMALLGISGPGILLFLPHLKHDFKNNHITPAGKNNKMN